MRKKDFVAIAQSLADARAAAMPTDPLERAQYARICDSLARSIADVCERQSATFNRLRFLACCGLSEKELKKGLTGIIRL